MIVRIWHGRTRTNEAEAYRQFVIQTGIKDYISSKGNLGAQIWQRGEGDVTHIWAVSWWRDLESVKAFAGDEIEKPKYYDEDKNYLLEFESGVIHAEAFDFRS